MNTLKRILTCPSLNQNIDYMNAVVIYFIQNAKKFYLDCNGYFGESVMICYSNQCTLEEWVAIAKKTLRDATELRG